MINPLTGRLIKKDGTKYKNLINSGFSDIKSVLTPNDMTEFYEVKSGDTSANHFIHRDIYHLKQNTEVINPLTGRPISYKTAKQKKGFTLGFENKDKDKINQHVTLIPDNKYDYDKVSPVSTGYWIKKGTKHHSELKKNKMLLEKMVHATKDRLIPVGSPQFIAMITDGYTYNEKKNVLEYPVVDHVFEVDTKIEKDIMDEIMSLSPNSITLICDGKHTDIPTTSRKAIRKLLNDVIHYQLEEKADIQIVVNSGGTDVKISIAFDGTKNCVIAALEEHFTKHNYIYDFGKLYTTYKYGVYGNDYEDISRKLKTSINIRLPLGNSLTYGKKRTDRAAFHGSYNNHHVSFQKKDKKETMWVDNFSGFNEHDTIVNMIGEACIETSTTLYRLKSLEFNEVQLDLQTTNTYSSTGYFAQAFLASNDLKPISPNDFNIDAIKTLCHHGIMFSNGSDANMNYDLKSAYTTFDKCSYYSGIPTDLTYCVDVSSMNFEQLTSFTKYEGFVYVLMTDIWTNKTVTRWVSMPYYRFYLEKREDLITPYYMLLSRGVTELNMECFKGCPKRTWHKVLGYLNRTMGTVSYATIDPVLAKTGRGVVETKTINGRNVYTKTLLVDKINNKYYPHVAGYVQSYTEIRLECLALEIKKKGGRISKVWVDGIDTNVKLYVGNEWHVREAEIHECHEIVYKCTEPIYCSKHYDNILDVYEKSPRIIIKGVAGTGKSTKVRAIHAQVPNSIVLVPTNELKKQYPNCRVETVDMVCTNPYPYFRYSTMIIDEYSMVTQEMLNNLLARLNPVLLILVGDTEQLVPVNGSMIDETDYTIIILEKIHRQHNTMFQDKLNKLRSTGEFKFTQFIERREAVRKRYIIVSSTHNEIDKLNKLGLMLNDNQLIDGVKIGSPVRFYKTTKSFNAGELGTITSIDENKLTIKKNDETLVHIKTSTFKKYHKLAYSVTYHAVQGKTIDGNVVINTHKLFDKKMKYVGCSRVVREDQLFLLIG